MRVRGPALLLFGLPIDINRPDAETLAALPGIGVGRAAAIVRVRAEAPFQSVSDLARVPGIGVGTITRVARRVVTLPADAEPFFSNPEIPHGLSPDDR
jgi:competence ComEA-like helix-hairpin-helix protein